ncbi:MAG: phosphodiesterase [Candidatus Saccharibacteria bacterium]|nr:phosphodiesterase [Pseudorhodobacter sp.]
MRIPLPAAFLTRPIAHRGYHDHAAGRVENSHSAVSAAVAAGYGIEIDLQLSGDGVAMVFHDDVLDRLTDQRGPVSNRSAAELGAIRLTGGTDTIPTLAQVLKVVDGRVPLLIEIKDQTLTMSPTDGRLEAATARDLAGYAGPVALMSFNPNCMALMARLAPHLPRGLTTDAFDPADWAPLPVQTCNRLRGIPDYDATDSSFISHDARDLASPRVAALKTAGALMLTWTIRSPKAEAAARKIAANVTFEGYAA